MYKFGKRSVKNIQTTHRLLQELATKLISLSMFDISVIDDGGLRTAEEQNKLFKLKRSKLDGYKKKSYHQTGMAIDFVPYINGGVTWKSREAFLHIAKLALLIWETDMDTKEYYLHWGGFWGAVDKDGDGKLELTDKTGWDMPHFELRTKPQTRGVMDIA